nr:hypothetical protein CFP56_20394 [Quercus suber]
MDCQDWLCSLVEYMIQQKVIAVEVLQATRDAMDVKTPLMPAPGGASKVSGQPAGTQLITASIMPRHMPEGVAQPNLSRAQSDSVSSQPAPQQRVGQSEWKAESSRFERYNYTATR